MKLIIAIHEGLALTYDTDDVEKREISTSSDIRELPGEPGTAIHRELTGYSHLHLSIDFKHGKKPTWMPLAEAGQATAAEKRLTSYLDGWKQSPLAGEGNDVPHIAGSAHPDEPDLKSADLREVLSQLRVLRSDLAEALSAVGKEEG